MIIRYPSQVEAYLLCLSKVTTSFRRLPVTFGRIATFPSCLEGGKMTTESRTKTDFRMPTAAGWGAPRAVADGGGGTIIATVVVPVPLERVFNTLTTNEVER